MSKNSHKENSRGKNCCNKNSCTDECKNLEHSKVIKKYINSNVQYIADDWFDPITVNPWGIISVNEQGNCKNTCKNVYWVANTGSKTLGKYFHNGELLEQANTTERPTGLVYNPTFLFMDYRIITVTLAGTIEGLRIDNDNIPAGEVELIKFNTDTVYTGVAINSVRLYVADFVSGRVEVYDTSFNRVGSFTDDALVASGYYAYNVAATDQFVYVTFARRTFENCAVSGVGFGYVDMFGLDGQLLYRFISRDPLNAPWGLTFSHCGNYLYVGNNGDGKINIFNSCTGEFIGPLMDYNCNPVQIGGLWGIDLNNDRLAFAAGLDPLPETCNVGQNGVIGYLQIL